ncbi:hypothetical protein [Pseudonocardia pini]|uniref:hypothetical protein n=1 Tax=Pseudonocardia pini TaxID=2758030 RepID=UPI0015F0463C|nr:hypothetical protein [Pseudonocardia pini]
MTVDLFRAADGRLEGTVHAPDDAGRPFAGLLDLLRLLEDLDLGPDTGGTDDRAPAD